MAVGGRARRHDPDGRLRRLHRLHVDVPAGRHHRRQARVHEAGRAGVVRRALRNIGLLYGHAGSVVYKMTKTPLPAGGDRRSRVPTAGWCHLERRLGDLEAPASLDVSAWPTAEAERAAMMKEEDKKPIRRARRSTFSASQRRAPQLRESEEELAAQGDHWRTRTPGTLGALIRGGRGARLREESRRRCSARSVCAGLPRRAEPLLASSVDGGGLRATGRRARVLHEAAGLNLQDMGADDAAMAAFGGALGSGAAPALLILRGGAGAPPGDARARRGEALKDRRPQENNGFDSDRDAARGFATAGGDGARCSRAWPHPRDATRVQRGARSGARDGGGLATTWAARGVRDDALAAQDRRPRYMGADDAAPRRRSARDSSSRAARRPLARRSDAQGAREALPLQQDRRRGGAPPGRRPRARRGARAQEAQPHRERRRQASAAGRQARA